MGYPEKFRELIKKKPYERVMRLQRLLLRYDKPFGKSQRILDFGTGAGEFVADLRELGFDAYGYDIIPRLSERAQQYGDYFRFGSSFIDGTNNNRHAMNYTMNAAPYRLPFEDDFFDVVISQQTLEHVFNLDETMSELSRITKVGGINFHIYPPRECFMERHTHVPLGHRIFLKSWFFLWAVFGQAHKHIKNCPALERAKMSYLYVKNATNYVKKSAMLDICNKYFSSSHMESEMNRQSAGFIKTCWDTVFPHTVILTCMK